MSKTVVGVFNSYDSAEKAVAELRTHGFMQNEISIVAKDQGQKGQNSKSRGQSTSQAVMNNDVGSGAGVGMVGDPNGGAGAVGTAGNGTMGTGTMGTRTMGMGTMGTGIGGTRTDTMNYGDQNISDGVTTGAVIGGAAGLLAGLGALAIPGVGPLLAAGPIAAALTGGVTGGLAGGLVDYGIPESAGKQYEQEVQRGSILAIVKADQKKIDQVAQVFRQQGASEVKTY